MTIAALLCDSRVEALCIAPDVSSQQAQATVVISVCLLFVYLEGIAVFFSSPAQCYCSRFDCLRYVDEIIGC